MKIFRCFGRYRLRRANKCARLNQNQRGEGPRAKWNSATLYKLGPTSRKGRSHSVSQATRTLAASRSSLSPFINVQVKRGQWLMQHVCRECRKIAVQFLNEDDLQVARLKCCIRKERGPSVPPSDFSCHFFSLLQVAVVAMQFMNDEGVVPHCRCIDRRTWAPLPVSG